MKIEIAKMERMSQTGSSLLRLIQNDHTPILDLLIRESVQNSIDASKEGNYWVGYDISTKQFHKSDVVSHFEGITDKLNARFKDEYQKSIVIRDYNTTGLTGPIHQDYVENNNFGNLLKLIYEISMPQEKLGAGGSWGLGKTVYFRVGIGLVIYYSRIKTENNTYASRLAACLVEDETKESRLLSDYGNVKRGIAWWGQKHNDNSTKPITNEIEINKILKDFNIEEYKGDETGTTVIIPFIDEELLIPKRDNELPVWWHDGTELYLKIALQRWYAPKIDNINYPYGPYLKASVNKELITIKKMEPLFAIINILYTKATTGKWINNEFVEENMVNIDEIKLHNTFKSTLAGYVAFTKINKESLKMEIPNNKRSPFTYLELEEPGDTNPPIVLYLRKPGMIVSYETESKWTQGIDNTDKDEYIIAIFIPNSENTIKDSNISLDEYLRQGEKADHSSWVDIILGDKRFTIVDRIQKRVSNSIKKAYNDNQKEENTTRSRALSKAIANALLPPIGFGNAPSSRPKKSNNTTPTRNKSKTGKLQILDTKVANDNTLVVEFYISLPQNVLYFDIDLQVESEGAKRYKGNEWEKESEVGVAFPVEIVSLALDDFDSNIRHEIIKTNRFTINSKVRIYPNGHKRIQGHISIKKTDPMIQPSLQERLIKEDR